MTTDLLIPQRVKRCERRHHRLLGRDGFDQPHRPAGRRQALVRRQRSRITPISTASRTSTTSPNSTKNQPKKGNFHDYHHFIHQSLLRGPHNAGRIHPQARASKAGLCPAADRAPITGSPVPHLTSLYHFHRAGEYGDRKWPGNCGGNLIKDLLNYFKPGALSSIP